MTEKLSPKLRFTKNGVFETKPRRGQTVKQKIANRFWLRALGTRAANGNMVAEIRFKSERGYQSEYFPKSALLADRRDEVRARLADKGYEWPQDVKLFLDAQRPSMPKEPVLHVRVVRDERHGSCQLERTPGANSESPQTDTECEVTPIRRKNSESTPEEEVL